MVKCNVTDASGGSDYLPIDTEFLVGNKTCKGPEPRWDFHRIDTEAVTDGAKWLQVLTGAEQAGSQQIDSYVNYLGGFVQELIRKTTECAKSGQGIGSNWVPNVGSGGFLEPDRNAKANTMGGKISNVPLPGSSASVAMGSAGGLLSTANDLAKDYKALMRSWRGQAQAGKDCLETEDNKAVLDDISWLFTPLQIMETPALREKSYAAGWVRSQLPTTVGDIGVNPGLAEEIPMLADGINSRLALWHQGSLVGATFFIIMLPEIESAVLVLTDTMAINDAADYIGQLLVETLLDSPVHHDYVRLASVSAECARKKYTELSQKVEEGRESEGPERALSDYVGSYVGFGGIFRIEVTESENGLGMLFQGRKSQKYQLQHHHLDTFTWFTS